jgi:hypothetical protein
MLVSQELLVLGLYRHLGAADGGSKHVQRVAADFHEYEPVFSPVWEGFHVFYLHTSDHQVSFMLGHREE